MREQLKTIVRLPVPALFAVLFLSGCLGDVPRDNPLDPLSGGFEDSGSVTGRTARYYPPYPAISGVRVRLEPLGLAVMSDSDGRFTFGDVPAGSYRLVAETDGFAPASDSVTVRAGRMSELTRLMRMDGLPEIAEVSLSSVHVSRWWPPPEDQYRLEVAVAVEDPDGVQDIESVWVEIPALSFVDTLTAGQVFGRYTASIPASELQGGLHAALGHSVVVKARDFVGAEVASTPRTIARIIDDVPIAADPQGLEAVDDPRPVLTWKLMLLPYPFTYRVDVVVDDPNVPRVVQTASGISPDSTSYRLESPLPEGTYYWVVWVVDAFGNRSRSKEAGFIVP